LRCIFGVSNLKVKAGGTGLGLYLSKKIAELLLKGSVSVESLLGQGSTFGIKIPRGNSLFFK